MTWDKRHDVTARLLPLLLCLLAVAGPARADEEDELLLGGSSSGSEDASVDNAPARPPPSQPAADSLDPADAVERSLRAALDRVIDLEVEAARGIGELSRAEVAALREELQSALIALGRLRQDRDMRSWLESEGYTREAPVEELPTVPRRPVALTATEVDGLAATIEAEPFNEGKLKTLREGVAGRTLTAAQASTLLERFSFSRDRVDVLVALHPRLAEGEDFEGLLTALKFESDRQAVRDRLGLES